MTEAGEGEDGRIKSAVGIGAAAEGLGDTVRVSFEPPEAGIPVARLLVELAEEGRLGTTRWPRTPPRMDTTDTDTPAATLPPGPSGPRYPPFVTT